PGAIENTEIIADRCNFDFKFGEYHLPEFVAPSGKTNEEYFKELCHKGLIDRYGERANSPELQERMNYEIDTIVKMGYVEYFLIVWDFINYAKQNGIMVGPGRGSAAGSIVAYSMRITDIDPIRYSLIFERFLNPERVSMPDIDVDFCYERRGEVIDYVTRKYGHDRVSQIITFGTMKAKMAVRDVARVLGATYAKADQIAKAIPFELDMTLRKALDMPGSELKPLYEGDEEARRIVDMAMALEGMPRHASTHAAGVVISKLPIDEYVPLYLSDKGPATQFTMTTIEELGLLKMDFLGLRNLTVIRDALELIKKEHGIDIDFSKMGYDDPEVYEMIAQGNTSGVFQLESSGMTQFMKNLRPTCFEDIVAGISLYRPGPMDSIPKYIENKKHPEKIKYVTDKLAPILDVTYGCLVYQEQVMQIVRDLGGYSYGRSDLVRRAMSKKKHDVMLKEKEYFINGKVADDGTVEIAGCVRNGISREAAEVIFEDMVTFASYAFNKSHAAAYAVLAYETGYLKHYYPTEFMAALMT
ncbi:MAG: DNA polymerase III subunit alpha, partial [Firmicutes bacterium]|nr:DNA polymerase III subunit alpha [Bacillota bacterium]